MGNATPKRNRRRGVRYWLGRGVLALAVVAGLAVVAVYLVAVRPDRRSVPYRQAMERLQRNPSAGRLLGEPVKAGWWVRGHAGADSTRLAVPVRGRQRSGTLFVEAERVGGAWVFSRLQLDLADAGLKVSLLENDRQRQQDESQRAPLDVPPQYLE